MYVLCISFAQCMQKVNCIRTHIGSVSAEMGRWGEWGGSHLQCDKLMATILLERLVGNGYLGHFYLLCMSLQ